MVSYFIARHPHLFTFLPAEVVYPHDHFLARTILRWIPERITPNMITMVRIFLTPVVFLIILFGNYTTGIIAFLAVAFTDAIDGSLARTRNKITEFGKLFDPLADKFLIGSMVLILVFSYHPRWIGIATLLIEMVIIVSAIIAKEKFHLPIMANWWGKIKMILQVFAVFLTLLALVFQFPYFFHIATWIFGLSLGFALLSLFRHGM